MATDNAANAVRELKDIGRTLDELVKVVKKTTSPPNPGALSLPYFEGSETLAEVPVTLDWVTPPLKGKAQILKRQGRIRFTMLFEEDQTDRIAELVTRLELESLNVSAYGRDSE